MSDDRDEAPDSVTSGDPKPGAPDESESAPEGPSARGSDDVSGEARDHSAATDDSYDELESVLAEADATEGAGAASPVDVTELDDPFDELDADIDETDLDSLFEEQFTESESGDLDADSVWEAIQSGDAEPEPVSGDEHIVPTRAFCARCEHVANPPDPRCTYEGSEILEFVDKDHVRVTNCPIVERRRNVSEIESGEPEG